MGADTGIRRRGHVSQCRRNVVRSAAGTSIARLCVFAKRSGDEVDELDAEESEGASGSLRLTAVTRGLGSAARRS